MAKEKTPETDGSKSVARTRRIKDAQYLRSTRKVAENADKTIANIVGTKPW